MTIVVGYVPKPEGEAALERAIAEAQLRAEELLVLNVSGGSSYADASYADEQQLQHVKQLLDGSGVRYELVHHIVGKEPAGQLVEAAERSRASLIVLGLRRRTSVGKFLMGSSASMVLMNAPCPVLAVPAGTR